MSVAVHPLPEPLRAFADVAATIAPHLARVDALHARYRAEHAAGRILPNSIEALRVELTYHSNAIEGSTLSLRETQLVVEGLSPPAGKAMRELYEARNHDLALHMIEDWARVRPPAAPITDRDLLDIHARVLTDIDARAAGRLRDGRVLIRGTRYIPPGPQTFDALLPALLALANDADAHSALLAAEFHYNLVAVHPFADVNGRTARIAMNFLLLRRGYPHAIIPVERRAEYLAALESANAGRCEPFARFIAQCIADTLERLLGVA
ncbi:MAG: Fic family protein [Phycisphaerales bacterium]